MSELLDDFKSPLIHGLISLTTSLIATLGISQVFPTSDLQWALTAVGFAGFFSGFFSSYYTYKE